MLDHLIYRAPDLEATIDDLERHTGVRAAGGGSHPGRGTRNALISFGPDTYLEILAPDPEQPPPGADTPMGPPDAPPGIATWAAKCSSLEETVEQARAQGVDLGQVRPMSRRRPDGTLLEWRLSVGKRPGDGLVPFLIDWGDAQHPAPGAPGGCSLISLRAEHPDPDLIAVMLAALELDLPLSAGPAPALIATLDTPNGRVELR